MASKRDIFDLSGPLHLTAIDWISANHRRSVAASLVKGVYVLERDRQRNWQGPQALAPPWWEFFHFQLVRQLIDDVDFSIFGAIYKFNPPSFAYNLSTQGAPTYVIAFRGTIPKGKSMIQDLKLDLDVITNRLHQTSRFEIAMQAVSNMVASGGDLNIWLAGHSLGSAMAMLAGKNVAKRRILLESFLFNPPFVSAPIEMIKSKKLKFGIRITNSLTKARLAMAGVKGTHLTAFIDLTAWVPHLFVNSTDPFCSEYMGYFEHRNKMEEIGAGAIERLATQNSLWGLFLSAIDREESESEPPLHLIPSANLIINPSPGFRRAHGIEQWWSPNLHLQSKIYHYR